MVKKLAFLLVFPLLFLTGCKYDKLAVGAVDYNIFFYGTKWVSNNPDFYLIMTEHGIYGKLTAKNGVSYNVKFDCLNTFTPLVYNGIYTECESIGEDTPVVPSHASFSGITVFYIDKCVIKLDEKTIDTIFDKSVKEIKLEMVDPDTSSE